MITKESPENIQSRKQSHLDTCLDPSMRGPGSGLENIHLPYDALFEISPDALNTQVHFLDTCLEFPMMFGAMTGGTPKAEKFNTDLRILADKYKIGLCLGSIRACLEDETLIPTYGSGQVECLLANIGASEVLNGKHSAGSIAKMCERLGCRALMIHLNGLQEWLQNGGNSAFTCDLSKLADFICSFPLPVLFKEVGSGLAPDCISRLNTLDIAGLELACRGGTSWVRIEAKRRTIPISEANLKALDELGCTLTQTIPAARRLLQERTLIASGGISNALDIIKCLALGADICAIAQPWYQIYSQGGFPALENAVIEWIDVSKLIWRSTGCRDLKSLHNLSLVPVNL